MCLCLRHECIPQMAFTRGILKQHDLEKKRLPWVARNSPTHSRSRSHPSQTGPSLAKPTAAPCDRYFVGQGGKKPGKKAAASASATSSVAVRGVGTGGTKQAEQKAGAGGMKQAEQKAVLDDFRQGLFNTLVATCIGEEGLDIPQVGDAACM